MVSGLAMSRRQNRTGHVARVLAEFARRRDGAKNRAETRACSIHSTLMQGIPGVHGYRYWHRAGHTGPCLTIEDETGTVVAELPILATRRMANGVRVCRTRWQGVALGLAYRADGTLLVDRAIPLDAAERLAARVVGSVSGDVVDIEQVDSISTTLDLAIAYLAITAPQK